MLKLYINLLKLYINLVEVIYITFVDLPMARKPPKGNSLAELNPELAKQWHTSKNGDLTPSDFFAKSVEMILTEKAENNY